MCSVIGYQPIKPDDKAHDAFRALMYQSRIRGLHAFGLAQHSGAKIGSDYFVLRETGDYGAILQAFNPLLPAVAHCRYSTSGDWAVLDNNQPLVVGSLALAWNGV